VSTIANINAYKKKNILKSEVPWATKWINRTQVLKLRLILVEESHLKYEWNVWLRETNIIDGIFRGIPIRKENSGSSLRQRSW
jgi:hypothetical protein